jgi:hypothetical protein
MLYVARQEGFEEMAEELFQDGVKQVVLGHDYYCTRQTEKGRYSTIFVVVILKSWSVYLTSG